MNSHVFFWAVFPWALKPTKGSTCLHQSKCLLLICLLTFCLLPVCCTCGKCPTKWPVVPRLEPLYPEPLLLMKHTFWFWLQSPSWVKTQKNENMCGASKKERFNQVEWFSLAENVDGFNLILFPLKNHDLLKSHWSLLHTPQGLAVHAGNFSAAWQSPFMCDHNRNELGMFSGILMGIYCGYKTGYMSNFTWIYRFFKVGDSFFDSHSNGKHWACPKLSKPVTWGQTDSNSPGPNHETTGQDQIL